MSDGEDFDDGGGGGDDYEMMDYPVEEEDLEEDKDGVTVVEISKTNASGKRRPQARRKEDFITTKFLTKYERARVLGTRALQISMGAPICVPLDGEIDCLRIAQKELQLRVLPIIVRRYLPDDTYEDWKLKDLLIS